MLVKLAKDFQIVGFYVASGAVRIYKYITASYVGEQARLGGGEYVGEVETIVVLPDHAFYISDNGDTEYSQEIDFHETEFEWNEGTDENIREVYKRYAN